MTCSETFPSESQRRAQSRFLELVAAVDQADSAPQLLRSTRALADALESHRREATAEPPTGDALACLVRILGYNNPGAAVAAVDGLIAGGPSAVSALLEGLDDRNYGARAWAVRALAGIGDVRGLDLLEQALARTNGNQSAAARLLGISRYALRYRMEKLKPA